MGIMQAMVAALPLASGAVVSPMVPWRVDAYVVGATVTASLTVGTDGSLTWNAQRILQTGSPVWYNPITPAIGDNYWVRVTPTTTFDAGLGGASTGIWLPLTSSRTWTATTPADGNVDVGAIFNLEFASDSGGSTIVGQMIGNRMTVFSFYYANPGGA
jgi:hypothetical protein